MSGASGGSTHAPSRCLYAALNIPRDARATDIKKAYRKEALVWHPDKNVANAAEAHVRFQELQHAYAVLSDPQERRWYDDHRDEILHPERYARDDDDDSDGEGGRGRTVNLTKYFSAMAFSGFGDDEHGFYQTYSRAFQEIWDAEKEWGDLDSLDGSGGHRWGRGEAPDLGGSQDSFEMANAFYSKWRGFVSGLSFGWVDDYNVNEAENRRVRRLMEKENNKKRAVARRKYHDDVRALVDFCQRRDKRIIRHKLQLAKDKEARERKRQEEVVVQKLETERRRIEWLRKRQAEAEEEEEARTRDGESAVYRVGDTDEDDEADEQGGRRKGRKRKDGKKSKGLKGSKAGDDSTLTVFRCAVCKKDFKSKGQMSNHETSKAHRKKMEELDAQMIRESLLEGHGGERGDDRSSTSEELEDEEDDPEDDEGIEGGGSAVGGEGVRDKHADDFETDFFMDYALREMQLEMDMERQSVAAGDPVKAESIEPSMEPDMQGDKLWGEADVSIDAYLAGRRSNSHGTGGGGGGGGAGARLGGSSSGRVRRDASSSDTTTSDTSTSDGDGDGDDDDDDDDDDNGIHVLAARVAGAGAEFESSDTEGDEGDLEGSRGTGEAEASSTRKSAQNPFGKPSAYRRNLSVQDTGDVSDEGGIDLVQASKRRHRKVGKETRGQDSASSDDKGDGGVRDDDGDDTANDGKASLERGPRRRRRQALKGAKAMREQHGKGKREGAAGKKYGASGSTGAGDERMNCRVCGKKFPSRSKLFAHVKAEGHALQT